MKKTTSWPSATGATAPTTAVREIGGKEKHKKREKALRTIK